MGIKFDYCSDLHVDFYGGSKSIDWNALKTSDSEILLIAGDISSNLMTSAKVLENAKKVYKHVCYVDGNHDHYQLSNKIQMMTVSENLEYFKQNSKTNKWTFLPFSDLIVGNTAFIGRNGWYDWNYTNGQSISCDIQQKIWNRYMSDASTILFDYSKSKETIYPNELAMRDAVELQKLVKKYESDPNIKNIVIMTHVLPIESALVDKSSDPIWNGLNGSFYNSKLKNVFTNSSKIRYWIFGHTHFPKNILYKNIQFVCNPKGYPTELSSMVFEPKTIELE